MRRMALVLGAGLFWLAACGPSGEEATRGQRGVAPERGVEAGTPRVRSEMLVSADWLEERLNDRAVVVLHVGADRGEYDREHIPGARFLPIDAILVREREGIANELPDVERLDSVFSSLGISSGSRVVVYGAPLPAARAFFTLDVLGHGERTALLDGGLAGWKMESRPVSSEPTQPTPVRFASRFQSDRVVDAGWIAQRLDDEGVALLDARPAAEFSGDVAGDGVPRPGHIPGAIGLFWQETLESTDPPVLRDTESLRRMFADAGVQPGDTVVAYCRTGMQASFMYFVSRYLGYETRMYDGSFMDWSRRTELPVER